MGQIHYLANTKPYNIQVKTTWMYQATCIIKNAYAKQSKQHIQSIPLFLLPIIMVLILKYYFEIHHDVIGSVLGFDNFCSDTIFCNTPRTP